MLQRVKSRPDPEGAKVSITEADFPAPFKEGLEYSSPARGTWNIVHTGMLIPQSHQIFVCAQGCLRGVVLTAAEMNALDRYSSIMIKEDNVLDGTMEELMIEGVTDIIGKLSYRPRAILLFISCQHFFLAYDQNLVFETLKKRFPDICFTDCYMIPTLRKSGITPDQKMRIQMYSMLPEMDKNEKRINLIGSNHAIAKSCEMLSMLTQHGFQVQALNWCETFEDYLEMGSAGLNLYYEPLAAMSAEELHKRLDQRYLYMPFTFDFNEIEEAYQRLCDHLNIEKPDFSLQKRQADETMKQVKNKIGDMEIAVDATFTFRIISFVKMLLSYGFHVTEIFADGFLPEEKQDFEWIREHAPWIRISSVSRAKMRFFGDYNEEPVLAIGQKAAYFTGTDHFVNVVESGGLYGFDGICRIGELMVDAYLHEKDRRDIIQRKGYGCESII